MQHVTLLVESMLLRFIVRANIYTVSVLCCYNEILRTGYFIKKRGLLRSQFWRLNFKQHDSSSKTFLALIHNGGWHHSNNMYKRERTCDKFKKQRGGRTSIPF